MMKFPYPKYLESFRTWCWKKIKKIKRSKKVTNEEVPELVGFPYPKYLESFEMLRWKKMEKIK